MVPRDQLAVARSGDEPPGAAHPSTTRSRSSRMCSSSSPPPFGNVLVLDGVIQCTERDEFSYQEMIAHLPIASHPNPERVLVIGGGDGGCPPRGPQEQGQLRRHHHRLLRPGRPAEVLFQQPYFALLKEALKPGGHISTRPSASGIHLNLIGELRRSTKELFPVADYAFTTIPTYPSGADRLRRLLARRQPQRSRAPSPGARLPILQLRGAQGFLHRPRVRSQGHRRGCSRPWPCDPPLARATSKAQRAPKKILLLAPATSPSPSPSTSPASPSTASPSPRSRSSTSQRLIEGLHKRHRHLGRRQRPCRTLGADQGPRRCHLAHPLHLPCLGHQGRLRAQGKRRHQPRTSSDAIRELEPEIKKAGHHRHERDRSRPRSRPPLTPSRPLTDVHAEGGKIKSFLSYCGGLPAPEAADNPLGYKFSWSSRGVLLALRTRPSSGRTARSSLSRDRSSWRLPRASTSNPAFAFVAYPNRDSTPFKQWYNIPEAETVIRGTLRYQGFPEFILALVKLGFLDEEAKDFLAYGTKASWADVTAKMVGAASTAEDRPYCCHQDQGLVQEAGKVAGNPLDSLCATLEEKCAYAPGERDDGHAQHKFEIETANGEHKTLTSTLLDYGIPHGTSSMAKLVGVPCAIATRLILEGHPALTKVGILAPYTKDICDPIRLELEKEGIALEERYV
ncbi:hypothetical protein L1887_57358 [Cichorium endivia]|nr:hypothetical protein L1887_57358 [Cichorium endivia]